MDISKPFLPCQLHALRLVQYREESDLDGYSAERIRCPIYDLHAERRTPNRMLPEYALMANDPVRKHLLEAELLEHLCRNCPEVNDEQYRCEENEDDGCPC